MNVNETAMNENKKSLKNLKRKNQKNRRSKILQQQKMDTEK
jgi:hypothetical protein